MLATVTRTAVNFHEKTVKLNRLLCICDPLHYNSTPQSARQKQLKPLHLLEGRLMDEDFISYLSPEPHTHTHLC